MPLWLVVMRVRRPAHIKTFQRAPSRVAAVSALLVTKLSREELSGPFVAAVAAVVFATACSGTSASAASDRAATGGAVAAGGDTNRAAGGATGGVAAAGGSSSVSGTLAASGGSTQTGGAATSASTTLASGGRMQTGGAAATGGAGIGGAATTGGSRATGGTVATGGSSSRAGASSGGNSSTGGNSVAGATSATGGHATGGASSSGGATPSGGTPATGGSTGSPGVRIVGRTAPAVSGVSTVPVRFSWPGVNINARFTGTQVSMALTGGGTRFTVVVDGGAPKTVTATTGSTQIASSLTSGSHDLLIWRNTEASPGGITQFSGLTNLSTGGALGVPALAPKKRIEIIGDSLSVGAGVEGNSTCAGGIDAFTNNYLAYGSVAARSLGVDVVTIAWSGIGVYRNYDGSTTNTMPTRYPYSAPNDTALWDFTVYQPDVTVINLGTNDFGSGDPGTAYETAYESFIKTVRSKYAGTYFVLIDMYGGTRLTRINNVVTAMKGSGETRIEALSFSSVQNNLGCNQHPNVAAQAAMGSVLANRLKAILAL